MKLHQIMMAFICGLLISMSSAHSQELPLWELGFGAGALYLPFYRGVEQTRRYTIPFPYIKYRGEHLSIDEGGAHGQLFQTDDIKLELSLAGGIPVSSDGNNPRMGMPDLDPTIEMGPSLEVRFWRDADRRRSVWLNLPLRTAISVNIHKLAQQGWTFSPYIEYVVKSPHPGDWKAGFAWGPLYADKEYHDYFYAVDPVFATPSRPTYQAQSGYSGHRFTVSLQKNIDDVWIGIFIRYDNLANAAFINSPLVNTDTYLASGIGFTWIFSKSKTMVKRD